jgi:hypothetical protein
MERGSGGQIRPEIQFPCWIAAAFKSAETLDVAAPKPPSLRGDFPSRTAMRTVNQTIRPSIAQVITRSNDRIAREKRRTERIELIQRCLILAKLHRKSR